MLVLKNVSVSINSIAVIYDITVSFKPSELIVITGENGGGKSSLACALVGLAGYETQGSLELDDNDITQWPLEKRAQGGIFLAYQYPIEVPGLSIKTFLQHAYRACKGSALSLLELDTKIAAAFNSVGLPAEYISRNLHEGFSGGQKKRLELVQMLVLEPRIIILDEIDSGLDAQGIELLHRLITDYKKRFPETIFIIITHNSMFAGALQADRQLTMSAGRLLEL